MSDRDSATKKWKIKCPKKRPDSVKFKSDKKDDGSKKKLFSGGSSDLIYQLLDRDVSSRLTHETGLRDHKFFNKTDFVKIFRQKIKAPWVPERGMLYVPPQDLIEKKNKDDMHKDVKSNAEDHERDIVEIIKKERAGELKGLPQATEGSK